MDRDKQQEAASLADFQWISWDRTSDSPVIPKMVGEVIDLMSKESDKRYSVPTGKQQLAALKRVVHIVLCNLIYTKHLGNDQYVGMSLTSGYYAGTKNTPKDIGYDNVRKTVRLLEKWKYITLKKGYKSEDGREAHVTKIKATENLIFLVGAGGLDSVRVYRHKKDLVVFKGKRGNKRMDGTRRPRRILPTPDTPRAKELADEIRTVNRVNRSARIELALDAYSLYCLEENLTPEDATGIRHIDFSRIQMHRVFHENRKLNLHGRWYGAWFQEIPEDFREFILIDRHPISELDYSSLHPSMLYCREGKLIPPGDDLYYVPDLIDRETWDQNKSWRKLVKILTLAMINAINEDDAVGATIGKWKEIQAKAIKWDKPIPIAPVDLEYPSLMPLVEPIRERHWDIRDHFLSGIGKELMTVDGQIATSVLLHFTRMGVPCLPVHDSFIIPFQHGDECWQVMQQQFKRKLGREINIDYKGPWRIFELYRENPSAVPLSPECEQLMDNIHADIHDDGFSGEDRGR